MNTQTWTGTRGKRNTCGRPSPGGERWCPPWGRVGCSSEEEQKRCADRIAHGIGATARAVKLSSVQNRGRHGEEKARRKRRPAVLGERDRPGVRSVRSPAVTHRVVRGAFGGGYATFRPNSWRRDDVWRRRRRTHNGCARAMTNRSGIRGGDVRTAHDNGNGNDTTTAAATTTGNVTHTAGNETRLFGVPVSLLRRVRRTAAATVLSRRRRHTAPAPPAPPGDDDDETCAIIYYYCRAASTAHARRRRASISSSCLRRGNGTSVRRARLCAPKNRTHGPGAHTPTICGGRSPTSGLFLFVTIRSITGVHGSKRKRTVALTMNGKEPLSYRIGAVLIIIKRGRS